MGKKLTNEEFIRRVTEKNEHVRNGEIEVLGEYEGSKDPIECRCIIHDHIWFPRPNDLCSGKGCKRCGAEQANQLNKSTHEDFFQKVIQNNEYVRNGIVEILGVYTSRNKPIQCKCTVHNYTWSPLAYSLYENHGCPKCGDKRTIVAHQKTHEQFLQDLFVVNSNISVLEIYNGTSNKINFMCPNGHVFISRPNDVLHGKGCPYCSNKKVLIGYNDINTTHPSVGAMLADFNDGYKYTAHSHKKIDFKCPHCGFIQVKDIASVTDRGFICQKCSDGISYPNRIGREILGQLLMNKFEAEWHPEWLKPYSYDNMFKINSKTYVLEMDGALGHGNEVYKSHNKDVKGLERDRIKDMLAIEHNVNVIRIDCKKSDFNYIKNNVIDSELNNLFDLSSIDWELCDKNSQKNLVKESCNMYMNDNKSVKEIADILHLSTATIRRYLKKGEKFGWCNYSYSKYKSRSNNTKLM